MSSSDHNKISELEKLLSYKTDFINNLSHEIRAPLQGIIGVSSTLAENWEIISHSQRQELISAIQTSGNNLLSLVNSLLSYSKYEAGMMNFEFHKNNIFTVIELAIDHLKTYALSKNIKIEFSKAENYELFIVNIDLQQIVHVLRNILSNAIKFSHNSKIEIKVDLLNKDYKPDEYSKSSFVKLSVKDKGPGVPESEIDDIFLPFSQASNSSSFGGTGIGLSTSYEIIKKHGGYIKAENNPDGGATFYFVLPLIIEEKPQLKKSPAENIQIDEKSQKIRKILFVDDESFCLISSRIILESKNFDVTTADTGKEALEHIYNKKFDAIFLDLMMPDMYGTEILEAARTKSINSDTPIIIQSGASDQNQILKAKNLGASAFLLKPYTNEEIISKLESVLDIYKQKTSIT